ncbi:MAG: Holliday junction resolvase RuvX [Muribaculaceae bacterium]|nr:Holliday junction resolvase RuvX [Muribaculaceae bacterium]
MGRLLAIDFGRKRCGIAATDSMRIVASGIGTVATSGLIEFVSAYAAREGVDMIVVGEPRDMHGNPSESTRWLRPAIDRLKKAIPQIPVVFFDERFTSVLAHRAMLDGGLKKMARRDKALVDEISATIILNDFLESRQYQQLNSL